jgi:hypothetical protein
MLTREQYINVLDKGLKSFEKMIGADKLEQNDRYIELCEYMTELQFETNMNEKITVSERMILSVLWDGFIDSL